MKRVRKRTVSSDVPTISKRLLTPCRRLGLTPPRSLLRASQTIVPISPLATVSSAPHSTESTELKPRVTSLISLTPPQSSDENIPPNPPELSDDISQSSTPPLVKRGISVVNKNASPVAKKSLKLFNGNNSISSHENKIDVNNEPEDELFSNKKKRIKSSISKNVTTSPEKSRAVLKEEMSSPKKSKKKSISKKKSSEPSLSQKSTSSTAHSDSDDDFLVKISTKSKIESRTKSKDDPQRILILQKNIDAIKERLTLKKEALAKMKNTNKGHEDNTELHNLINIWRKACQSALEDLLNRNKKRRSDKVEMEDLLNLLHIPCDLVKYDKEQMCFL